MSDHAELTCRWRYSLAALLVERVVRDVDLADGFEDAAGLPVDLPVRPDDGAELAVVSVDSVRPEKGGRHLK